MTRWQPQAWMVYLALAVLSAGLYVAFSRQAGEVGFPLDDAWIHQVYARSLGWRGEFAFAPGQPSAGSTAPLWTAVLALGYWWRADPLLWTYGLGMLTLAATAWLAHQLVLALRPRARAAAWAAGLLVVAEWHTVWSAASGMETLLMAALALMVLAGGPRSRWALPGLAAGLAVWVRPDGLLLPALLPLCWLVPGERRWPRFWLNGLVAVGLVLAYLGFNWLVGGSAWPNTLYAKQAEYAALLQTPLPTRLAQLAVQPFIGVTAVLAPGLVLVFFDRREPTPRRAALPGPRPERPWVAALALVWVAALVGAYALRLPVTYQHGRYLMPTVPVLVAVGAAGLGGWVRLDSRRPWRRVAGRAWVVVVGAVALAFWVLGARAYAQDVQIIQTEMVRTAKWIALNTEDDAVIAAHDIGALGYFGERPVLDLAGLVTPEVIPIMRAEAKLAAWLDASGADYLMTFPGWYPQLTARAEVVYTSGGVAGPAAGGENMVVYRWGGR
ncbi:MAG: hypothetical protein IT317_07775 [Anaerolineales bacterium]|nr:hypothetical protein [Anaerolineales bacterium]